jgi:hypothetical protein
MIRNILIMHAETTNLFVTNCAHILTPTFPISWHPTYVLLFAHLLTVTVNVWVATPIWATPSSWTEGSSATKFYSEKSRPGLRPTYPPIKLVLGSVLRGNQWWYKLTAFLHPVSRLRKSGAITLRPLCALWPTLRTGKQYACDMCRSSIKRWAERCMCGGVERRLARQSEQTELAGWFGGT